MVYYAYARPTFITEAFRHGTNQKTLNCDNHAAYLSLFSISFCYYKHAAIYRVFIVACMLTLSVEC